MECDQHKIKLQYAVHLQNRFYLLNENIVNHMSNKIRRFDSLGDQSRRCALEAQSQKKTRSNSWKFYPLRQVNMPLPCPFTTIPMRSFRPRIKAPKPSAELFPRRAQKIGSSVLHHSRLVYMLQSATLPLEGNTFSVYPYSTITLPAHSPYATQ